MKKFLIELKLVIEIRGFEIKKLKSVIKIIKIKIKKIEYTKNKLTLVVIRK